MARILDADEVRLMRMRSQRLSGPRATDVPALLRQVGALQAQDTQASRLAVRPRSDGLDAQAVRRACNEERSVVRTWAMRGTLHMVPAQDVGWMVALLGPIFAAADRRRRLQLGLDDGLCARALPALREILGDGRALTRAELVQRLAEAGGAIDPRGPAPAQPGRFAALPGSRSGALALPPQFARQIQAGGGWIPPTVAVDGRIVGTWRLRRAKGSVTVAARPFAPLERALLPHLEAEAADVGRFLHADATLAIEE